MKNYLVFHCINLDSVYFNAGESISAGESYQLFTPEDQVIEDKVTDTSQERILKWLMSSKGAILATSKASCR